MSCVWPELASDANARAVKRCEELRCAARGGSAASVRERSWFACCGFVCALFGATVAIAQEVPAVGASTDADGVQRVTITGGSYFFTPARIVAKAGMALELIVRMEQGIVPHRFVLATADGKTLADIELVEAPKTVRVELVAGDYAFYCPNRLLMFRSHRERGMSGVLEVRE